jgi:hypothetical protein
MTALKLFSKDQPASVLLDGWLQRGRSEVFMVNTYLTPDLAKLLLANNPENRGLRLGKIGVRNIRSYAGAMRRNEWKLNGSTIVVARSGELNDGQNRCEACIAADVSVPTLLIFGVERDTRTTLDQGAARTPGDVLVMVGETNANVMATYLQFRLLLETGRPMGEPLAQDELLIAREKFPFFHEHHAAVGNYAKRQTLSVGCISAAHGLCAEANPEAAARFAQMVCTGVGIPSVSHPAARLRKIYEDHRAKKKGAGGRQVRTEFVALWIIGFNNFVRGRTGALTWRDKDKGEAFPQAVRA